MQQGGNVQGVQLVFLLLLVFIVVFGALARRLQTPFPIVLVIAGLLVSLLPGLPRDVDVFYDNSPAFRLGADAAAKGVRPLAWFANATPLRSGWAWGQSNLDGAVEAVEAPVGKGTLYLFAPEITFRGQPHGTFKWLFNGIYSPAETSVVP